MPNDLRKLLCHMLKISTRIPFDVDISNTPRSRPMLLSHTSLHLLEIRCHTDTSDNLYKDLLVGI